MAIGLPGAIPSSPSASGRDMCATQGHRRTERRGELRLGAAAAAHRTRCGSIGRRRAYDCGPANNHPLAFLDQLFCRREGWRVNRGLFSSLERDAKDVASEARSPRRPIQSLRREGVKTKKIGGRLTARACLVGFADRNASVGGRSTDGLLMSWWLGPCGGSSSYGPSGNSSCALAGRR